MASKFVSVNDFLSYRLPLWPGQRVLNCAWVESLKAQQKQFIRNFGSPLITGSFILIWYNRVCYLADGQHRLQMLKELNDEMVNFINTNVLLEIYDCDVNLNKAQNIYSMANANYNVNGTIDKNGNVFDTKLANNVVEIIQKKYITQVKANLTRAPCFDIGDLLKEINISGIMKTMTVDDLVNLIIEENNLYGKLLFELNPSQYSRCTSNFFLPYKEPKCRWFKELVAKLSYKK